MQHDLPPTDVPAKYHLAYLLAVLFALLLSSILNPNAEAATLSPDEYRAGKLIDKFDDTWQQVAVYEHTPVRSLQSGEES